MAATILAVAGEPSPACYSSPSPSPVVHFSSHLSPSPFAAGALFSWDPIGFEPLIAVDRIQLDPTLTSSSSSQFRRDPTPPPRSRLDSPSIGRLSAGFVVAWIRCILHFFGSSQRRHLATLCYCGSASALLGRIRHRCHQLSMLCFSCSRSELCFNLPLKTALGRSYFVSIDEYSWRRLTRSLVVVLSWHLTSSLMARTIKIVPPQFA